MIDKRDHIGGNCYDYIDKYGIRTSKYGVHIFHTKYDRVKEYVQQFSEWVPYEHRVLAKVGILVSLSLKFILNLPGGCNNLLSFSEVSI